MSERKEFVTLALSADRANVRELCRRFGISAPTAYKWLRRYRREGNAGLADLSRRPRHSPGRTSPQVERAVLGVRDRHPAWGARKLRAWLIAHGHDRMPSSSTITSILRRNGRINAEDSSKHTAWQRFERQAPNELWQMDFKGHFAMSQGGRCHPLTVLDDHSRFAVGLQACSNELGETVQERLTHIFRHYGLPDRMLMDNGAPWATHHEDAYTHLTVWLMTLGIDFGHGRPYHPQTQGKDERFHRTLKAEVLQGRNFTDLTQCQAAFDHWRPIYNLERPHEALSMKTPAARYQVSHKPFPQTLQPPSTAPAIWYVEFKIRAKSPSRAALSKSAMHSEAIQLLSDRPLMTACGMSSSTPPPSLNLTSDSLFSQRNSMKCVNHVPEHPLTMSPV